MAGDGKFGWYWGRGEEPEGMHGPEDSRDAILQVAMSECDGVGFTICEADKAVPAFNIFDAGQVLEQYEEHNVECWSEDGPDIALTSEAERDLELVLAEAFGKWAKENDAVGNAWCFGTQRNIEYFPAPQAEQEKLSA